MKVLTKDFKLEIKELSDTGEFEGYAAVFGNVDAYGDVIEPGAFKRTLDHWNRKGKPIPILWQHKPDEPIGATMTAYEDTNGLYVKGKLILDVPKAKEAYHLMKANVLGGLSIGYRTIKEQWDGEIRRLKEIQLYEWSPVTFPANELATYTSVKAVVPYQNLPLADMATPWNAAKARQRVKEWADGDMNKYRKAFLWYDAANADNYTAYKLPIADVVDGALKAVPRAIVAAAAAIQGARGGVNIPESDVPKVKSHIAKYYKKMGKTPPWESASLDPALITIIEASKDQSIEADRQLLSEAFESLKVLLKGSDSGNHSESEGLNQDEMKELWALVQRMKKEVTQYGN